jgi:hypothetical protein
VTRLSDDAWRAKMEGKTFRQAEPLPLFDAPPPPPPPARPITSEEVKAHAKAIGSASAINHPPYTREDGCERPKLPNDEAADPWLRAHAGSALAARRWTPEEAARVDAAIRLLAATRREFTADDVWDNLPGFLVTKGLAGRLMAAANAGLIANTGKKAQARRGGAHDHAQTLSVWIGTGCAS